MLTFFTKRSSYQMVQKHLEDPNLRNVLHAVWFHLLTCNHTVQELASLCWKQNNFLLCYIILRLYNFRRRCTRLTTNLCS